ncbi:MAG TPA: hypothetical protein VMJ34_02625 [Bryobacteraceae bacterium]|nr:hypothetical protein [Bryobacteraceae bacterium]
MKAVTVMLMGMSVATGLLADCPTKERPTTEAEQRFYLTVTPALQQAMSATPAGWTSKDMSKVWPEAQKSICAGSERFYRTSWSTDFTWMDRQKAISANEDATNRRLQEL